MGGLTDGEGGLRVYTYPHLPPRTQKPQNKNDSKNPKGPGGEGILFISGDFNKAITLSVERLRVKPLMKRAGAVDEWMGGRCMYVRVEKSCGCM